MEKCSSLKIGLALGGLFALCHAVWAIAIAISQAGMQKLVDWIMKLHSMQMTVTIIPFDLVNSLILVVVTFVVGFVIGWLFSMLLCCCGSCCCKK